MKQKLLILIVFFNLLAVNAQPKLRIEPGVLLDTDSDNLGLLLNIEPNIKVAKNAVIGLRFGIAVNPQKFEIIENSQFFIDDMNDNGIISFMPTFDYYLHDEKYALYVGLGIGYYLFNDIDISRSSSTEVLDGSVNDQPGVLMRAGFELGKTRLGLEYNFITKANIELSDRQIIGTVDNSYLGLYIGYTFGLVKSVK